jgi:thioredoxin 2
MNDAALLIPCLKCGAMNRSPESRLGQGPNCGRCHEPLFTGLPIALQTDTFDARAMRGDLPVLVDFWAPWCGPCLNMAPHFAEAARKLEPRVRLAKVDTEAEPTLGARFAIRSIPTLILFAAGREVARQSGGMGVGQILQWTDNQLQQRR